MSQHVSNSPTTTASQSAQVASLPPSLVLLRHSPDELPQLVVAAPNLTEAVKEAREVFKVPETTFIALVVSLKTAAGMKRLILSDSAVWERFVLARADVERPLEIEVVVLDRPICIERIDLTGQDDDTKPEIKPKLETEASTELRPSRSPAPSPGPSRLSTSLQTIIQTTSTPAQTPEAQVPRPSAPAPKAPSPALQDTRQTSAKPSSSTAKTVEGADRSTLSQLGKRKKEIEPGEEGQPSKRTPPATSSLAHKSRGSKYSKLSSFSQR